MSSYETAKKRKADGHHQGDSDCESNAATEEGGKTSLAAILAEMKDMRLERNDMKSEMDDMKGRLCRMDELESKCKLLETKCNSLESSMKILIKENKWKYSAPSIPASHWVDLGFDGDYIEGMKYFLKQMKESTIELRSGKDNIDILLNGGFEYDEDTVLLHDDILLPHWKEFANALQLYQNSGDLLNLSICNVQLTSSVIGLLASALKGKQFLKIFEHDRNQFVNAREGIDFAVKSIGSNQNLEQFVWLHNPIGIMDNAGYLVEAITTHPHIDTVSLKSCVEEDINGYEILRSLFTSGKSFSHIGLERNNIRTGGGTGISDYLATNPPLKRLYLAGNHLTDDDAVLIAFALKQNTNLEHLGLGDNDITENGKNALSNAIYDPTSLNSMIDCNHTCAISGVDPSDILGNWRRPNVNMARKIYHLLSLRNREGSNVQHLNQEFDNDDDDSPMLLDEDDSLMLVPNVLASVQQYYHRSIFSRHDDSDQVHPLSIMYEILRSWKMPALYENCGMPRA